MVTEQSLELDGIDLTGHFQNLWVHLYTRFVFHSHSMIISYRL